MSRTRLASVFVVALVVTGLGLSADAVALGTAHGVVEKADKDTLVILPRKPDGKFGKSITLQVTGTSKIGTLQPQVRAGKTVMTQKETEAKDLQPKQTIAVIFTDGPAPVLLTAVVQAPDKTTK